MTVKATGQRPEGSGVIAITDEQLAAMSGPERTDLARRLAALASAAANHRPQRRRWLFAVALGGSLAMVPWTVILAATLPDRYVAEHWNTTWVGFDALLFLSFAVTAWAVTRRSPGLRSAPAITATLLACDVWFDLTTASTTADLVSGAITAAAALPLAALMIYKTSRVMRSA